MRLMPATVSPLLNKNTPVTTACYRSVFIIGQSCCPIIKISLKYMIKHDIYGCHVEPCMR